MLFYFMDNENKIWIFSKILVSLKNSIIFFSLLGLFTSIGLVVTFDIFTDMFALAIIGGIIGFVLHYIYKFFSN